MGAPNTPTPDNAVFEAFAENLKAARNVVLGGMSLEQLGVTALNIGDVYRGALTQAVSALDMWVGEEVSRRAAALDQDVLAPLPSKLRDVKITLGQAEDILHGQVSLGEVVAGAVDGELYRATLQRPRAIANAFTFVRDGELWREVAAWMRAHAPGFEQVATSALTSQLDQIVERRNQIAHNADLLEDGSRTKRPINGAETARMIDLIEWIVRGISAVLGDLPDPVAAHQDPTPKVRRPSSVALIARAEAIADGTQVRFLPSSVFEEDFAAWIGENPDRALAHWIADGGTKVLRWAVDGVAYSTSALVAELFNQAGVDGFTAYNGPTWWGVENRGTLAEIAEQLYRTP